MAVDTRRSSSSSSLPFDHHAKLSSPRATLTSSSPRVVGGALASPRASLSASAGSVTPRRLSTSVGASNGTLEADRIEYQVKQLFEQNTINGVREIESSTIADLNAKKKELRMLVGNRYRDLIDSADSIIAMRDSSHAIRDHLLKIEQMSQSLVARHSAATAAAAAAAATAAAATSSSKDRSSSSGKPQSTAREGSTALAAATLSKEEQELQQRFVLAKQIKILVDTPEQIWSALESGDYLAASDLFLTTERIHSRLLYDSRSSSLLASIPLLSRQWAIVNQFPRKIKNSTRASLVHTNCSSVEYARALYALILLDDITVEAALVQLLDARRDALVQLLDTDAMTRTQAQPGAASDRCSTQMAAVASTIVATLQHVYDIFVRDSSTGSCMLTIVSANHHRQAQIESLDSSVIQHKTLQWLRASIELVRARSRAVLAHVTTAQELMAVEQRVWAELARRTSSSSDLVGSGSIASSSALSASGKPLSWSSAAAAYSTASSLMSSPWQRVCEAVLSSAALGELNAPASSVSASSPRISSTASPSSSAASYSPVRPPIDGVDLWNVAFADEMLARCKAIVDSHFASLSITEQVAAQVARLHAVPSTNSVGSSSATTTTTLPVTSSLGSLVWSGAYNKQSAFSGANPTFVNDIKARAQGIAPNLRAILDAFDAQLHELMQDLQHCLQPSASATSTKSTDIRALQEHVERACYQAVGRVLESLSQPLRQLEQRAADLVARPSFTLASAEPLLHEVLFIGRMCHTLCESSKQLPTILRAKDNALASRQLSALTAARVASPRLSSLLNPTKKKQDEHELLSSLKVAARTRYLAASIVWAAIQTRSLSRTLEFELHHESWHTTSLRRQTWEEVVLAPEEAAEAESEGGSKERTRLPFQPSPFVATFLFEASRAIHKAYAHTTDNIFVRFFAFQLAASVQRIYEQFLQEHQQQQQQQQQQRGETSSSVALGHSISKEGSMQLLFDIRFLSDVLSGRIDVKQHTSQAALLEQAMAVLDGSTAGSAHAELLEQLLLHRLDEGAGVGDALTHLMRTIKDKLDPIDQAFYEPLLELYVQRCYHRSAAFLGYFLQLNRLYSSTKQKSSTQEKHNVLPLAPPVARFPLLPISNNNVVISNVKW